MGGSGRTTPRRSHVVSCALTIRTSIRVNVLDCVGDRTAHSAGACGSVACIAISTSRAFVLSPLPMHEIPVRSRYNRPVTINTVSGAWGREPGRRVGVR